MTSNTPVSEGGRPWLPEDPIYILVKFLDHHHSPQTSSVDKILSVDNRTHLHCRHYFCQTFSGHVGSIKFLRAVFQSQISQQVNYHA